MTVGNETRRSALAESLLAAGLNVVLHLGTRALGVPLPLRAAGTVATLGACTWLLHRRGTGWNSLGLGPFRPYHRTVAWALGLFLVLIVVVPTVTGALGNALGLPPPRMELSAQMRGNLGVYLLMLIPVGWGAAAFGEEMIYRGFIFSKLSYALGGGALGAAVALLSQSILFAAGHLYLGPRGVLNAGLVGIITGAAYLANGRALWPLIIAHGLVDSVGLTALYLGLAHG